MMADEASKPKKRGGARPGAGRKPSTLKGVLKNLPRDQAAAILADVRADQKWIRLLNSKNESIRLDALRYLTDRAYGKARQNGQLAVGVMDFTPQQADGQQLTAGERQELAADQRERIIALERELGLHSDADMEKAVAEAKERMQKEFAEREPLKLPPAPIVPSAQCDKHGPYDGKQDQHCPVCAHEWAEANQKEQQHWRGLMPGEPRVE